MTPSATAQADGRASAVAAAGHHFDSGTFVADLARRVAIRTESQDPASGPALNAYLEGEIAPSLAALGFTSQLHPNPEPPYGPLLVAQRMESDALPTVLVYGHGDVIRGQDKSWTKGAGPWTLAADGAARPTTRASTASTSPPWPRCWRCDRPPARAWVSTSSG
jgi:hypothetical protein